MVIEYATTVRNTTVRLKMISQGTVFEGKIGSNPEKLFIKSYDSVISLENGTGWTTPELEISNYKPVKAKVVVQDYE